MNEGNNQICRAGKLNFDFPIGCLSFWSVIYDTKQASKLFTASLRALKVGR